MLSKAELKNQIAQLQEALRNAMIENEELKEEIKVLRQECKNLCEKKDLPRFYISSEKYLAMIEHAICVLLSSGEGLGNASSLHLLSDMRKLAEKE